jgi:hypothetical protein|tara:strand:+ start:269 stop:454 length:186 start_codon:yes stop_codon:yes gene_type:complete
MINIEESIITYNRSHKDLKWYKVDEEICIVISNDNDEKQHISISITEAEFLVGSLKKLINN